MATTEKAVGLSPLSNFDFNDDVEFFGQKIEKTEDNIIKEVKLKNITTEEGAKKKEEVTEIKEIKGEDGEDDEDMEFFPDVEKESSTKLKTKPTKKQDVEEETEEDDDTESEKIVPKKKSYINKKEEVEDESTDKENKGSKETEEETEEEDESKFYTTLAKELKEKGILQLVEVPKDKEITEEQFFELQNEEFDLRVDEALEGLIKGLDDDGKAFLKFKKDGGKTHDFLATYASSLDMEALDDTDPNQVDKVIRHYLSTVEGLEGDEFDERLKYIKDGGKAKVYANKWFEKIKTDDDEQKEAIQKAVETAKKTKAENNKAFNEALTEVALKTDAVGAFTFTKADQKRLVASITKSTVKVGKDRYIPETYNRLNKVLQAKTEDDKRNLLLLAHLLENNFDIKDVAVKTTTKIVKEVKSKLKDAKTGVKAHSSNRTTKRDLSDYFDE